MLPVAQLMDYHVVPDLQGREQQQTVEIQISLTGTAAPAGTLSADGDFFVADTYPGRVEGCPVGEEDLCLLLQVAQLRFGQRRQGGAAFKFTQLLPEPMLPGCHKVPDGPFGQTPRCPDQHTAVGPDLQGKRLPAAADQGVGNIQKITSKMKTGSLPDRPNTISISQNPGNCQWNFLR